jgi:hypothetical protein
VLTIARAVRAAGVDLGGFEYLSSPDARPQAGSRLGADLRPRFGLG